MKDTEGPLFAAALREKVLVDYEETSRNGTTLRPASWREREEGERQHVSDEGAARRSFTVFSLTEERRRTEQTSERRPGLLLRSQPRSDPQLITAGL